MTNRQPLATFNGCRVYYKHFVITVKIGWHYLLDITHQLKLNKTSATTTDPTFNQGTVFKNIAKLVRCNNLVCGNIIRTGVNQRMTFEFIWAQFKVT